MMLYSMRIGVNAFPLRVEGGGARYVFAGLLSALLKAEQQHHYIIFAHFEALRLVYQVLKASGVGMEGAGPDPRVRVIQILDEGQIYAYRHDFDLLFGPLNNLNPRLYDRPSVAILHDIQEQYFPEYFSKSDLVGRQEVYPEICRSATTLVAISEFCKRTFIEKFDIEPDKIEVVPNAPQAELIHGNGDGVWRHDPLPSTYLFYPANCYRHKNHAMLLDAAEALRAGDLRISIVFSGFELPGGFPLRKEIAGRGLSDQCTVFTDLPAEELRHLYRHSIAVVLPTKFEGFGMPAVEAAACGCPVVCSDLPALREILGDSALYFDPASVDDLSQKIRQILEEPSLRQRLIESGSVLAGRFTWENSARQMLEIFQRSRERFIWGRHRPNSVKRPRIGVNIRLIHNGLHLVRTVESLLVTGYPDLVMRCEVSEATDAKVRGFLASAGVKTVEVPSVPIASINGNGTGNGDGHAASPSPGHEAGYAVLRKFAQEESLDLVSEIAEGGRYKASGLDSAAWGFLQQPQFPVHLGESLDWNGDRFMGSVRLRLTGDALWKMEGYLYPELFFIHPKALEAWPQGLDKATNGGDEWRWELLREARHEGKLHLLRRTVADTDQQSIGPDCARLAAKAGMFRYYVVGNERRVKVKLLRRVEPAIKRAARVLPVKWQDAGTRLWYHLSR